MSFNRVRRSFAGHKYSHLEDGFFKQCLFSDVCPCLRKPCGLRRISHSPNQHDLAALLKDRIVGFGFTTTLRFVLLQQVKEDTEQRSHSNTSCKEDNVLEKR